MRRLYREFFRVPERGTGKISEKVLIARISVTVVLILACMVMMCLSAYAYFSCSITSDTNVLTAARYELDITVQDGNAQTVSPQDDGSYLLTGGRYHIELRRAVSDEIAQVGYCRILIPNAADAAQQELFTASVGRIRLPDGTFKQQEPLALTLVLPDNLKGAVSVKFVAEWGTCAAADRLQEGAEVAVRFDDSLLEQQPAQNEPLQQEQQNEQSQQEQQGEQPDTSDETEQSQTQPQTLTEQDGGTQ